MKILSITMLLLMLTNCAGGNMAKVKFGKRCTAANENGLKESSYVWVISKEALKSFDKRINKSNCSDS
tara:strand:+ start:1551 stop:1754 length:204 start_codon:yes stop_codon:yes gene_type:complete